MTHEEERSLMSSRVRSRSVPDALSLLWRRLLSWMAAAGSLSALCAESAAAQGVRYTLLPSTSYVRWSADLGLERALLFGGRAVADFGPLVGLEGHYLVGGIVGRFSETGLTDSLGGPLGNGTLDLVDYGLGVRASFGNASFAPFLRAGGSVLRFDDGARAGPRQIAVTYGGGIRINASPRLRAEFFAEDMRFRLDRSALAPGATPGTDPQRNELRSNLVLGAGLGFVLGGGLPGEEPRERWSVASVPLEAFVGRLDFAGTRLPVQSVAGVRAGIDVGNYVGLRGYFLSGVASGFSRLEGVRSMGGEAQFNLNAAPRLAPYLIVGGGTLDFEAGVRDSAGAKPAARTLLILGGGVGLRLTDKFRLNVAARDLLHGRDATLGDVAAASQLDHNWLYSAGVTVSIGRSRRGIALVSNTKPTAPAADTASAAAAPDSLARPDSPAPAPGVSMETPAHATGDSAVTAGVKGRYHSATSVVLPVPTEGELYIRYGPARADDTPSSRRMSTGASDPRSTPGVAREDWSNALGPLEDTTTVVAAVRRMLDARWAADSALIHRLVVIEMARSRADEARRGGANPASVSQSIGGGIAAPPAAPATPAIPGDAALLSRLRTDRDLARAETRRLQLRLDSIEAARRASVTARADAERTSALRAQQGEAEDAAAARDAAHADSVAALRADEELDRRREDALLVLERSIPSVTSIRESERGLVIALGNNVFASGERSLSDQAQRDMREIATVLALYPDAPVAVEGHTDATGSAVVNQRLSEARAEAVRLALVAHGIGSERIIARGYGQTRPVADNTTADGRARNRRAEVIILGRQRPTSNP